MEHDIREGDLYRCGPHMLACGDLIKGHFMQFYGEMEWEFTYSDPPWGAGLAKMFRTMNNQKGQDPKYPELLEAWADVASYSSVLAFGEMGADKRWRGDLIPPMERRGFSMLKEFEVVYGSEKRVSLIEVFAPSAREIPQIPDLSGLSSSKLVKKAMSIMPSGSTVVDPCIGMGHTLRGAHGMGIHCLGMELNPSRLASGMRWLEKKGISAELVHRVEATV